MTRFPTSCFVTFPDILPQPAACRWNYFFVNQVRSNTGGVLFSLTAAAAAKKKKKAATATAAAARLGQPGQLRIILQQRDLLAQAAVAAASAARRCWWGVAYRDSKTLPCSGRRSCTAATLAFGAGPIWAANAAQKPCVLFGLALLHSSNACVRRSAGTFFL